jgi:C-terminal processing protease CtpA/Prc
MRKLTTSLLLAALLAGGAVSGAAGQTVQTPAMSNSVAYCQYLDPANVERLNPNTNRSHYLPLLPTLSEQLKTSTDATAIVETLLDAYAPLKPEDYDAVFANIAYRWLTQTYYDAQNVSKITSLKAKYRGQIKTREDLDAALEDLAQTLGDPGTKYTSAPDQLALAMKTDFQGTAFFGAYLKPNADGEMVVDGLMPGSTADLNGFRVGDTIVSINGKPLKGMSQREAELLELFPAGNSVQIASLQDGRSQLKNYMVQKYVPYKPKGFVFPKGVGYIRFPTIIDEDFGQAVIQAVVGMQEDTKGGLSGLVLDLRYLQSASGDSLKLIMKILIDKPLVLHGQIRQGQQTIVAVETIMPEAGNKDAGYTDGQLEMLHDSGTMPLVILVNESTSSPLVQEVVQALQETRANFTVVGTPMHGPGEKTAAFQLPNCGVLTATTELYTNAQGVPLASTGVAPDVRVEQPRDRTDGDTQLAKAIAVIVEKTKDRATNLVTDETPVIPGLKPVPELSPPADVDQQRLEHERFMTVLYGLVAVALAMVAVLYVLLGRPRSLRDKGSGSPKKKQ